MTVSLRKSATLSLLFVILNLLLLSEARAQFSLTPSSTSFCPGESKQITLTATIGTNNIGGIRINLPTGYSIANTPAPTVTASNNGAWSATASGNFLCLNATTNGARLPNGGTLTITATVIAPSTPPATGNLSGFSGSATNCPTSGGAMTGTTSFILSPTVTPSVTISSSDADNTICSGIAVTFTATPVNGGTPNYQWQKNGVDIAGATSATYTTTTLASGDAIRVIMTPTAICASPTSVTSNSITTTVVPSSVGGTVSAAQTICNNTQPQDLTLSGNTGLVVKWQKSLNATFAPAEDIVSTSTTLTSAQIGALTQNTYFRAVVQSGQCTPANSSAALITVRPELTATISGSTTICAGESATLTVNGTAGTKVYYTDGTTTSSVTLSGAGTATISVNAPTATTTYTLTSVEYATTPSCTRNITGQSATVTVNPRPTASISYAGTPYCASGTASVTQSGQGGGTYSAAPTGLSINTTTGEINLTASAAGTYTVTYSFTDGTCPNTTTTTVTVKALPVVNITGSSSVCIGSTTTLVTSNPGGTWTSSDEMIATVSSSGVVSGIAAGVATITYSVTQNGCTTEKTQSITVNATVTPSVSISSSATNNTVCAGTPVTFTATPESGGTNPSYQWQVAGSNVGTNSPTYTTSSLTNGAAVKVIMTSNTTCASPANVESNTITTTVTDNVTAGTISGYTTALCIGNTVDLNTDGTATDGSWSSSDATVASVDAATGVVTAYKAGSASITYTVNSGCGSPKSTSVTVSVNANVTSGTITGNSSVCMGNTITLSSDGTSGGAWSSSDPAVATVSSTGMVSPVAPGITTISYAVNSGCGSPVSTTKEITVNPRPTASISYSGSPYCATGTAAVTQTGQTGGTYSAAPTGLSINTTTGVINLEASTPGTYTVTYSFSNGTCSNTTTTTVTVNALPVVAPITGPNTVCVGSTITLANTTTGGVWSSSDKTVATVNSSGVVSGVTAGTVTISYAVTANGCITTKTYSVTVNAVVTPAVSISSSATNNTICSGTSVIFTATPTNEGTPTYQWQKNGVDIAGATSATYTTTTLASGDAIKVLMTSTAICASPASVESNTITTTVVPSSVGGTVSSNQTLCSGSTPADLTLSGHTGAVIKWQKSLDAAFTTPVDIAYTGTTLSTAQIGTLTQSTYFRAVVQSGQCASANSSAALITVRPALSATLSGGATICAGQSATLTVSGTAGSKVYYTDGTSTGSVILSGAGTATISVTTPTANTTYTLTSVEYATAPSCTQSITGQSATVTVNPRPTATITSSNTTICSGSPTTITGSVTAVGAWTLTLSEGTIVTGSGSMTYSKVVNPTNTTTYTITALSDANCPATASGLTGSTVVTTQSVTATPIISGPLCSGTTYFSGTLSESNGTIVEVFKNGTSLQTTTVSKGTWSISGISALLPGDVITASATATGKCISATAAGITVQAYSEAPIVNSPIYSGFTTVSGTSTEADGTNIKVYIKGTTEIGQATVSSGVWTATVIALNEKDVVTARATAAGECQSTSSTGVTVLTSVTGASGDYRSAVPNGNWTDLSSWEIKSGSSWTKPNANQGWPGQNRISGSVNIQSGHTITTGINLPFTIGGLIVDGTLNVDHNITIVSGIPVYVNGTIKFNSTAYISGGGTGSNAVNFTLAQGASLITAHPSGITTYGDIGSVRTVGTRSFINDANYTYNGSTQQETGNGFPNNGIRTLTVNNTNGLRLSNVSQIITGTTNLVNGALIIPAGSTLTLNGPVNVTQPGSTAGGSISGSATSNLTFGGSGAIPNPLIFSGPPAQFGNFQFLRTGSGATIATNLSIAGLWNNNAGNLLNLGASTITFNGSTAQSIAGAAATIFNNLTINNSAGVNLTTDVRVNGNLTLTAGNLNVKTKVLTLGAAASVTTPGEGHMIIASEYAGSTEGELRKIITGPGSQLFPVGDNQRSKYTPVTLNVKSGTGFGSDSYVSLKVRGAEHPNNGYVRYYLNRYWLVRTNLTSILYDFTTQYDEGDVVLPEDESIIVPTRWNGQAPWQRFPASTINTATNVITLTDQVGPGDFTGFSGLDPVVTITANPGTAVCSGTSVTMTASSTGNPPTSYLWSDGSQGSSITYPVTGTQSYSVTLTDANGFTGVGSITLTTSTTATNNIISTSQTSICKGSAVGTITGTTPSGGSGNYTYLWERSLNNNNIWIAANSPNNEKDYNSTAVAVSPTNTATSIQFRRTVGATGCTPVVSNIISMQIKPLPTGTISGTTTICSGSTATLSIAVTGTGPWNGTLSNGQAFSGTSSPISVTVSPTTTTSYTISSLIDAFCTAVAAGRMGSATVTVNLRSSDPTSATASSTTVCSGQSTTLTLNGGGGGTGEIIRWYTENCGSTLAGTGNNLVVSPSTTTTYYGRYETPAPCNFNSACASVTITVVPSSVGGAVSADQTICYNTRPQALTLTGNTGAVVKWQKSLNTSFSPAEDIAFTGTTLTAAQIGGLTQSTYFRAVVQSGACTPANSSAALITVRPALSATLSGGATICAGQSATLTVSGTAGSKVYYTDGTSTGSVILSGAGTATISVTTPIANTTYTLTSVEYATAPSCTQSITGQSATVTVNPRPTASISYPGSPFCATGTISVTQYGQGGGAYSAPAGLSINTTTGEINLETSTPGTYTVTYSFSDANCSNTTTTSVTVNALPVVAPITGPSAMCVGSTITLANTTTGGLWSSSDKTVATVNSSTGVVTGMAAGTTIISYAVTANGCTTTKTYSVTVNASVPTSVTIASSDEDNTICSGTPVTFTATPVNGGTNPSYQWKVNGNYVGTNSDIYTTSTLSYLDVVSVALSSSEACASPKTVQSNEITITVVPSSIGGTVSTDQTICYNTQPQDLTLTGNTGAVIKWQKSLDAAFTTPEDIASTSNTLSSAQIGTLTQSTYFRAVVQSGQCAPANSSAALITVRPELTVSIPDVKANDGVGTSPNTVYIGYEPASTLVLTALVNGNQDVATYQWNKDNIVLSNETSQSLTVSTAGNYSVSVTSNGCTETASKQIFAIDVTCGSDVYICENGTSICEPINSVDSKLLAGATLGQCPIITTTRTQVQTQEKLSNNMALKAFPNPTTSGFNVVVESDNKTDRINLRVMDLYGRMIQIIHNVPNRQTLKLGGDYRPGVYFIEMIQGSHRQQLKVIKQPD